MVDTLTINISAILALIPASLYLFRGRDRSGIVFWAVIVVAGFGPLAAVWLSFDGAWRTGVSLALWITVALSVWLYAVLAAMTKTCWRLGPLLLPYLLGLAILATLWSQAPERPMISTAPLGWIGLHIATSIFTYAILTVAAVAGLAVSLQERSLKSKRPTALNRLLPSVADAERLQIGLMISAQAVLSIGLVSGMATQFFTTGDLLVFDHKILLTLSAFLTIGGMLIVHYRTGLRGRKAARVVLVAYLLLTLGYPGVKFVTDVLLV
jgi:ABC-type uncharacterized transport system permease subunit